MTQAQEIINTLAALGVTIRADGTMLVVAPKSKVPAELAPEIRQRKGGMMALLSSYELNELSPNQPDVNKTLLNALGVPVADTAEAMLQTHKKRHPIIGLLLDHRETKKRVGTYGKPWLKHLNQDILRIHPDWRQIGSEPGRMSCRNPNLQQVPRAKEYRACLWHAAQRLSEIRYPRLWSTVERGRGR